MQQVIDYIKNRYNSIELNTDGIKTVAKLMMDNGGQKAKRDFINWASNHNEDVSSQDLFETWDGSEDYIVPDQCLGMLSEVNSVKRAKISGSVLGAYKESGSKKLTSLIHILTSDDACKEAVGIPSYNEMQETIYHKETNSQWDFDVKIPAFILFIEKAPFSSLTPK